MIHVLLIIMGLLALNKMYDYNHMWEKAQDYPGVLPQDVKSRLHKTERDVYAFSCCFMVWFYIWRMYKLISEYNKLKNEE